MKATFGSSNERNVESINRQSIPDIQEGVVQAVMIVVTLTAALIGVWGVMSLCSGVALSGGLIEVAKNWFAAIGV